MGLPLRTEGFLSSESRRCRPSHRVSEWVEHPKSRISFLDEWHTRGSGATQERTASSGNIEAAIESSRYICDLEDDWDEFGSPGYNLDTWRRAVDFLRLHDRMARKKSGVGLPAPTIGPGPEGSVDIYWKTQAFELLVTVPFAESEPAVFYGDDYGKQTIKGTLSTAEETPALIHWLVKP